MLEVKTSIIPEAGKGLFASTELLNKKVICVYSGTIYDTKTALKLDDKTYLMRLGPETYVDAREDESVFARFINDPRNSLLHNAEFKKKPESGIAEVIATRDIRKGEEIFVNYGKWYWAMSKVPKFSCKQWRESLPFLFEESVVNEPFKPLPSPQLVPKRILMIISGSVSAYKSLDIIRSFMKIGHKVSCILTKGGSHFVTPLSVSSLSGEKVFQEMFSLTDETEIGHIELSRRADLVLVCPATANLLAKMTHGICDDLASTCLLASNKQIVVCPAMNVCMWEAAATQDNIAILEKRGVKFIGPDEGKMACGEIGKGRLSKPEVIVKEVCEILEGQNQSLRGCSVVVTAGPTVEDIDPVRYIANRSSGKQGYAIAGALRNLGASVTLVSGPTSLESPAGVKTINTRSALDMLHACEKTLPADVIICAAAVADWRPVHLPEHKIKKDKTGAPPMLKLIENPDILRTISDCACRPKLCVGFAAETTNIVDHASDKLLRKGCDWILANDVSPASGTFGGDSNTIHFITSRGQEDWPTSSKKGVANKLAMNISNWWKSLHAPCLAEE
eukprot:TRINITY_DN16237_c0_g1_i1.p1 TRINITY_DN16237_c0_g1~~TRINITY_DN16237_c0_g1_i1.p1  ORF type:complete len:563 (-),score=128.44 TRINITY_DN16237_c0_g1_i1:448-2136(-)